MSHLKMYGPQKLIILAENIRLPEVCRFPGKHVGRLTTFPLLQLSRGLSVGLTSQLEPCANFRLQLRPEVETFAPEWTLCFSDFDVFLFLTCWFNPQMIFAIFQTKFWRAKNWNKSNVWSSRLHFNYLSTNCDYSATENVIWDVLLNQDVLQKNPL